MHVLPILIISLITQQTPLASIEGSVLQAGTSQPIARAAVELSGGEGSRIFAIGTGADGGFEFRVVPPGRYRTEGSRETVELTAIPFAF